MRIVLQTTQVTKLDTGCQKGSNAVTGVNDLEPKAIGTYDDGVLKALDKVLAQLVPKGIKAIISPHDGNAFGYNRCFLCDSQNLTLPLTFFSCDLYCSAYGDGQKSANSAAGYYQSTTAKAQIDARYKHILNFVSPSSGKKWGQWKEAILAFDIENEPFQQAQALASQNDPPDWLYKDPLQS